MGAVRIIILAVAAVAAILLMLIVGKLASHKPAAPVVAAAPAKPMTRVVVAAHDLSVGTALAAADLTWQPWPADAINPAFVTDGKAAEVEPAGAAAVVSQANRVAASVASGGHSPMDAFFGAIVKSPILANEPVTNGKVVRGGEGGYLAVVLRPGMRAMAIPVSATTDAGGFILPGDRVDIIQARQSDMAGATTSHPYVATTLVHNIRVLAIDQTSQLPKAGGQSVLGSVATVEVSPADAELIAVAKAQGEMLLTLRAYTDSRGASGGARTRAGLVHIVRNGVASDISVTP